MPKPAHSSTPRKIAAFAPVLGALGIVFGDIGTSPLYAASTTFGVQGRGDAGPTEDYVLGSTATLIYALLIVVTVLYVRLLMRTSNRGEGGLLALFGLLRQSSLKARSIGIFTVIAILGAAMFLGDGVITPAISVLSAVEGLEVIQPELAQLVVPIAVVILIGIFVLQRLGTNAIGRLFGPIMTVWFAALALTGIASIALHPAVLQALSPHWVILFFIQHPELSFLALGAVVLAVTGAEALYADLGHFGRPAISHAWLFVVFPALTANYLGQASLAIREPKLAATAFYSLVPSWATLPMVILATLATIIASQAVISGTYSVVQQAWRLGLFPPLRILHTSSEREGQIYVPAINVLLAIAVLAVTLGFRGSAALASAYGIAVTLTISITTTIYIVYQFSRARRFTPGIVASSLILGVVLIFFAGNLPKAAEGGWLPLAIGVLVFAIMTIWWVGANRIRAGRHKNEMPLSSLPSLIEREGSKLHRVPGTAVFITRNPEIVPIAMRAAVTRNHALQSCVILLSWETVDVPTTVGSEKRIEVKNLPSNVVQVAAKVGFRENPRMLELLAEAQALDAKLAGVDLNAATFYASTPVARYNPESKMPKWAQYTFLAVDRIAPDPLDLIELPRDRTIVLGREVRL